MIRAKFATIKQHIIERIESGVWGEQTKLPSENQLADEFGCSRMTARRAVTELCDIGVLERSQGIGTFVSGLTAQSSVLTIRNISDEIKSRGHGYSVLQLALTTQVADKEISIALDVEVGATVFYSELLHYEQDEPLQLECRYVNPKLVPNYLQQDFSQCTPHEYLSQVAPLTEAHHKIQAMLPSLDQVHQLELRTMEACLLISRRTWSRQGVVSFAKLIHPGSRFHLGGHLTF
ncbi:histidine utilization repressor [Parashewanella spongiae]|uniref:Histidine utilization repressor n=1 Tax=Parashewanella spongiae TaxID=342950 RepID=A0A3A6TGM7_9GAMM|nr:histidine utilization repressor [Parashewanella spongiae]MCL1078510.1 histidine utilization repressor [Parashewanella spongiae]RJY14697.1 histidine utilization repressor [Parashewanella spongiae]